MDPQPAIPAPEAPAAPTEAELDAAMLRRMAEICMEVGEAISRRARADLAPDLTPDLAADPAPASAADTAAAAADADPAPANDNPPDLTLLGLAAARVSRALRLTLLLKARLRAEAAQAGAGLGEEAGPPRTAVTVNFVDPADGRRERRKAEVGRIIRRLAEAELTAEDDADAALDDDAGEGAAAADAEPGDRADRPDPAERVERLVREAAERLESIETYGDLLARPLSEFVEMLCHDLGLAPDWARLAGEPWAQAELTGGAVGPPLAAAAPPSWRPPSPGEEARWPAAPRSGPPPGLPEPPSQPRPPPPTPEQLEAQRIAAATAERWRFAEYGPSGRGAPPY